MTFVRTRVDIVDYERTCEPRYGWNDSRRIVCLDEERRMNPRYMPETADTEHAKIPSELHP